MLDDMIKDKEIFEALRHHDNVCISGLTAAGKTTHSHLLAGEFGMTYVSGSQIQHNFMVYHQFRVEISLFGAIRQKNFNSQEGNMARTLLYYPTFRLPSTSG